MIRKVRKFYLSLLLPLLLSTTLSASIFSWFQPQSSYSKCEKELLDAAFRNGMFRFFTSSKQYSSWMELIPRYHGLKSSYVTKRYSELSEKGEVLELLEGSLVVPSGRRETPLRLSGGWAQDYLFVPRFGPWNQLPRDLSPVAVSMGEKLRLDPFLVSKLVKGDARTLADSAWILAEFPTKEGPKHGTLKVSFFDREMTPDGPWPRFTLESPISPYQYHFYTEPRELPPQIAMATLEGFYSLKSSLSHWGLLPLELVTNHRINEHDPANYPERFKSLFNEQFRLIHRHLMIDVIEGFDNPGIDKKLEKLLRFRNEMIPKEALAVAEISRYFIPAGAPPSVRAHLYYGLVVSLSCRPEIKKLYLLAPRLVDNRLEPSPKPEFEIVDFADFGASQLRELMEQMSLDPPLSEDAETSEKTDLLKSIYIDLGFEVYRTDNYISGLPNGAYSMRGDRNIVMNRLIDKVLETKECLLPQQLQVMLRIQKEIAGDKSE